MKDRVINIIVSVIMVIVSLYPMYMNLKSTVTEVNEAINGVNLSVALVNEEIKGFQDDLNDVSSQLDSVKYEVQATIRDGLHRTEDIINKELDSLTIKINNIKSNAIDDVKTKTLDILPDIKF